MVPQIIPYGKRNELMIQVFRNIRKKLCSKRIKSLALKMQEIIQQLRQEINNK